eukprot:g20634.t1
MKRDCSSTSEIPPTPAPPKTNDEKLHDFIIQSFGGTLRNQVTCKKCSHKSVTDYDTGGIVTLEIPEVGFQSRHKKKVEVSPPSPAASKHKKNNKGRGNYTGNSWLLADCLDKRFLDKEVLVGENRYFCSRCKVKVDAVKEHFMSRAPSQYLILHLNRTRFNIKTCRTQKIQDRISFPLEALDLSPFLTETQEKGRQSKGLKSPRASYLYDLVALVLHHGRGMDEGHFTCMVKENDEWLLFNDSKISHLDSEDVESAQKEAYMLFYERRQQAGLASVAVSSSSSKK